MNDAIVFVDKSVQPGDTQLETTLKTVYPCFVALREATENLIQEWKYYNRKSGWIFKIREKKKAVLYLTPLENTFNIGMALRESERDTLIDSPISGELDVDLSSLRKYSEGYGLRFTVRNENDLNMLLRILRTLNKI